MLVILDILIAWFCFITSGRGGKILLIRFRIDINQFSHSIVCRHKWLDSTMSCLNWRSTSFAQIISGRRDEYHSVDIFCFHVIMPLLPEISTVFWFGASGSQSGTYRTATHLLLRRLSLTCISTNGTISKLNRIFKSTVQKLKKRKFSIRYWRCRLLPPNNNYCEFSSYQLPRHDFQWQWKCKRALKGNHFLPRLRYSRMSFTVHREWAIQR